MPGNINSWIGGMFQVIQRLLSLRRQARKIEFQKAYIFLHKICNVRKKDWGLYTLLNQRALKGRTNALAYLMSLSRNLNSKAEQMWWYVRNFV